jgi:hypothetical protein
MGCLTVVVTEVTGALRTRSQSLRTEAAFEPRRPPLLLEAKSFGSL